MRLGTAGWAIPAAERARFPDAATLLARYAGVFSCVEINSSFYRPHRPTTYARWARSVPAGFRFALKVPREITHRRRLVGCAEPLGRFLDESAPLEEKRGVLLVQLPPSFAYDAPVAEGFFGLLRARYDGAIACEPRHASWFEPAPDALLRGFRVARVAADPAVVPAAALAGGWERLRYVRLHGAPHVYWSAYGADAVALVARAVGVEAAPPDCGLPFGEAAPLWVIFDNTAQGAATADALALQDLVSGNGVCAQISVRPDV